MTRDGLGDCYGDFGFRWDFAVRSAFLYGDFDTAVSTIFKQVAVDDEGVGQSSEEVLTA
jgi:hypothetical protein